MNLQDIWYLKNEILDYARTKEPHEVCGYLVQSNGSYTFLPSENIHQEPSNNFAIASTDYVKASALGEISAVVHSHTNSTIYNNRINFSEADKVACEASGLPWVLVVLPQGDMKVLNPSGYRPPLLGREFVYGVLDCYSLVRDALAEAGIHLNDYPRGEMYEWDTNPDWNLFEESFEKEGFVEVDSNSQILKYDVLLMQVRSNKTNHVGIFWEPDKNIFIHQLIDRYSEEAVYGGYWKDCTVKIVRHKQLAV